MFRLSYQTVSRAVDHDVQLGGYNCWSIYQRKEVCLSESRGPSLAKSVREVRCIASLRPEPNMGQ